MCCSSGGCSRWAGRNLRVETLNGVLQIHELLIDLAEARLNFFEIVREPLDLRGHAVKARARIGLHVLHGLLHRCHGAAQPVDVVVETANDGLDRSMVLDHLRGHIFLSLHQGSEVTLEVYDFAGDRFGGARAHEASADGARENGCAKNGDIAYTHGKSSLGTHVRGNKVGAVLLTVRSGEGVELEELQPPLLRVGTG